MKNSIFIDIDTERDQPILIGKPKEITPPTTPEEAAKMIITDISHVCEALCSLIHVADQNGYATKEALIAASITLLNNMLVEQPSEPTSEPTTENNEEIK
jgi:hypothetical protein